MSTRRPRPAAGPRAIELLEESVHIARGAPLSAWVGYLAGTVPWCLGLGYFWASASWLAPRPAELLWHALGLTVLFIGLKTGQAVFCAHLRAQRLGEPVPPLGPRALLRIAGRQAMWQGWAIPALMVSGVVLLPLVFCWTFFGNITALAASREAPGDTVGARAYREARRWPAQAHLALLYFKGVWLAALLNVGTAFYVLPWLARTLLGVDSLFGLSGWSALNSTFLALVGLLTWLSVDPLFKAYHVLRTYYGEARLTGADLRPRAPSRVTLAMVALWLAGVMGSPGSATRVVAASAATPATASAEVDQALDTVLAGRDFRWQLQPLPVAEAAEEDNALKAFVRAGLQIIQDFIQDMKAWFEDTIDWFERLFRNDDERAPERKPRARRDFSAITQVVLYTLLVVIALALVWLIISALRNRAPAARSLAAMPAAAAAPPDLNDEQLEASRLPANEWLDLARAQLARGEWRLALRALYLATLAGLGTDGLVTLARAKTNLDYERELARRAAGREALITGFRTRRLEFERVWYGRATATEPEVRTWLAELERPPAPPTAQRAGGLA
jgi:hypothetical protein